MSFEEKRAWSMAVVSTVAYAVYLVLVLGRSGPVPLTEVSYVPVMLWTIGASVLISIVISIAFAVGAPQDAGKKDQRDREINQFGEYSGRSFLVTGGVAALGLAMAEVDHFWIANVIYLAFFLSAVFGSVAKIVAYRQGF